MARATSKILSPAETKAAELDKQIEAQTKVVAKAQKELDKLLAKKGKNVQSS